MSWISVNDRLPQGDQNVLAVVNNQVQIMNYASFIEDGETFNVWAMAYCGLYGDPEWDDNYEVTHWMPIPPLPPNVKKRLLVDTFKSDMEYLNNKEAEARRVHHIRWADSLTLLIDQFLQHNTNIR